VPKPAPSTQKAPRRRAPDPAGRVDILVSRLLEVAVEQYGDLPLRGVYGTYKTEINRAIRKHLGKVRFHMDGYGQVQIGGSRVR